MNDTWKKLAFLLLFLTLPLQGVAATLHALHCPPAGDDQHAMHSHVHGHDHAPHGASHDHDGDTSKHDTSHFCCNLLSSGMLTATVAPVQPAEPVFVPSTSLLATLFIPERPQRPPRR